MSHSVRIDETHLETAAAQAKGRCDDPACDDALSCLSIGYRQEEEIKNNKKSSNVESVCVTGSSICNYVTYGYIYSKMCKGFRFLGYLKLNFVLAKGHMRLNR